MSSRAADPEATLALAHALRTPLTALALGLGLLEDGVLGPLNEGQADVVRTLVREVGRLSSLVDRELDTGHLGLYAGPPPRVLVDLAELVREVAAPIERQAVERGVAIRLSAASGVHVTADPLKLGWVAVSLMGNALRYSPPGGSVDVDIAAVGGEARLSVRDRGPGLDPATEAHLFERDGGAGLFLAHEIVEEHGGRIAVASAREGASKTSSGAFGTLFVITLPLAVPEETP